MQNLDSNQTQFSEITPILESGSKKTVAQPTAPTTAPRPKAKAPILVAVAGVVLLIVFVLLLVLISKSMSGELMNGDGDDQTWEQTNGEIDPLLEEIYDLDDQLQASDPSLNEVPLPPVDMTLRLDPARRRQ